LRPESGIKGNNGQSNKRWEPSIMLEILQACILQAKTWHRLDLELASTPDLCAPAPS
jgi:hypothetical protein